MKERGERNYLGLINSYSRWFESIVMCVSGVDPVSCTAREMMCEDVDKKPKN